MLLFIFLYFHLSNEQRTICIWTPFHLPIWCTLCTYVWCCCKLRFITFCKKSVWLDLTDRVSKIKWKMKKKKTALTTTTNSMYIYVCIYITMIVNFEKLSTINLLLQKISYFQLYINERCISVKKSNIFSTKNVKNIYKYIYLRRSQITFKKKITAPRL